MFLQAMKLDEISSIFQHVHSALVVDPILESKVPTLASGEIFHFQNSALLGVDLRETLTLCIFLNFAIRQA
jgi:hypothetical protein